MRQRNAQARHATRRGGDAGHDLEGNAVRREALRLLAAAAEDEGIAALEADDVAAAAGELDEQSVDLVLRHRMRVRRLAHEDPHRSRRDELENVLRDEAVVDDDLRLGEEPLCLEGHELGVAGTGSDQMDRRYGRIGHPKEFRFLRRNDHGRAACMPPARVLLSRRRCACCRR